MEDRICAENGLSVTWEDAGNGCVGGLWKTLDGVYPVTDELEPGEDDQDEDTPGEDPAITITGGCSVPRAPDRTPTGVLFVLVVLALRRSSTSFGRRKPR